MPDENQTTETQSALTAGQLIAAGHEIEFNGEQTPAFVVPAGHQILIPGQDQCEQWLARPFRKTADLLFADVDSFIRYFLEQREDRSRIFSVITDTSIAFRAVLDFHDDKPSFKEHVAQVCLRPSKEFTDWTSHNGKQMTQGAFAQFLEEHADLFVDPKGADLLELVQNLEATGFTQVDSIIKLQNGTLRLRLNDEVSAKGTLAGMQVDLPSKLTVGIAPFLGVAPYQMTARLRYRLQERKVTFWYETVDAHLVVRTVAADVVKIITEKTGLVPFNQ